VFELKKWEEIFKEKAFALYPATDPSHDYLHIARVVKIALELAFEEKANVEIVLPAAYFHDFVTIPKNDPRRKIASQISAAAAVEYLASINYPSRHLDAIKHAIEAHSFSANIKPETLEAQIVQDSDRLDGIGAIGVARCFSTCALMQRPYYDIDDVFAQNRELDDKVFAIDHFPIKLFKIAETMHTGSAHKEAQKRLQFMKLYLQQLKSEL
jgi:uncharacterized protein